MVSVYFAEKYFQTERNCLRPVFKLVFLYSIQTYQVLQLVNLVLDIEPKSTEPTNL